LRRSHGASAFGVTPGLAAWASQSGCVASWACLAICLFLLAAPVMAVASTESAASLVPQDRAESPTKAAALASLREAVSQLQRDDLDVARRTLDQFAQLSPQQPVEHFLRAWIAMRAGELDPAAAHTRRLLDAAPTHPQALLLHGIVSYQRGDYSIADDTLTRLVIADPRNTALAKLLAVTRLRLSQPGRAATLLGGFVSDGTLDRQGLAILASAELRQGDLSSAYAHLEQAVAEDVSGRRAENVLTLSIEAGEGQWLHVDIVLENDLVQRDALTALVYLRDGDLDKVLAVSQALQNGSPESPLPDHLAGLAHLDRGAPALAEERFNLALAVAPDFVPALMGLAQAARDSGRWEKASETYAVVLQREPARLDALVAMAEVAAHAGDETAAEGWLREAVHHHPSAVEVLAGLVESLLRQERAAEALPLLARLDTETLQRPPLLRLHGMALLQAGDFAGAIATLRQFTQVQSDSIEAWFQLGRAQAAAGDTDLARQSLERAVVLDSAHEVPMVWIGLAELELWQGRYDAALAMVVRIRQGFPQQVAALDVAAKAYRGLGDDANALAADEQALQIDYTSERVRRVAQSLASSGQASRARNLLRDWLVERPDDAEAWATLGALERSDGQQEAALFAYEQVVRHGGPPARVQAALAELYLSRRDPQRARTLARAAFERMPWDAQVVSVYARVLREAGATKEGLALLRQAALIAPAAAEIGFHLAEALVDDGHFGQAEAVLEQIQRDHPDAPQAAAARGLRERLPR
jgi:putative PEP-CTERM system TPR-repeat lipoprotein